MSKKKTLLIALGIIVSFIILAGIVVVLAIAKIINFTVAALMLVALLGMYVGFGILVALYRLVAKLD